MAVRAVTSYNFNPVNGLTVVVVAVSCDKAAGKCWHDDEVTRESQNTSHTQKTCLRLQLRLVSSYSKAVIAKVSLKVIFKLVLVTLEFQQCYG